MRQLQLRREKTGREARAESVRPIRLPILFFVTAIFFFALGTVTAPWAAAKLNEYFYQLSVLAWVHTFTLGWITPAILGLIYYYAPAGARQELRFPRLATAQFLLYLLGASGVMAHFLLGSWDGVWMAGVVVALSVIMFAMNAVAWIAPKFGRGAAETGLLMALFFLLCACCLGALLAFDKDRNLLPGTVLRNLSAHAHLAVVGWVSVALCAISYRFMTTVVATDKSKAPNSAIVQIFALAAAAAGLFALLIAGVGSVIVWTCAVAALLIAYAVMFERFSGLRGAVEHPAMRHAAAGLFFLILAVLGGIYLAAAGVNSLLAARVAAAYGLFGLLGWISNFIIAISYQWFPEFVARIRSALGWPYLSFEELSVSGARLLVFYIFNSGVLIMGCGLLAGGVEIARAGGCLIATGGVVYSAAMGWTLSFAYRRGAAETGGGLLRAAQD
jgi:hypothetical protein